MHRHLLNTIYMSEARGYLHLRRENVVIEVEGVEVQRIPLVNIQGIVAHDMTMISPGLLRACADQGVQVSWFSRSGRFIGSLRSPTTGNVLLRVDQYKASVDEVLCLRLAKTIVRGKATNARLTLLRRARDAAPDQREQIQHARRRLDALIPGIQRAETPDQLLGHEGNLAREYFAAFNAMILAPGFTFEGRHHHPPLDPLNALLSFVYTLTTSLCVAACEGVGLDPQVGFFHALRVARPSCALDLVEEFRASLADRFVFSLINRRQISSPKHFVDRPGGAVYLSDEGRKIVLRAWHSKLQEEVHHTMLDRQLPFGLIPHAQARLLARHLRGDLEDYTPFEYT